MNKRNDRFGCGCLTVLFIVCAFILISDFVDVLSRPIKLPWMNYSSSSQVISSSSEEPLEESGQSSPAESEITHQTKNIEYVYLSRTGKRYHESPSCSGMTDPRKVTLEEAKELGREPCGTCIY